MSDKTGLERIRKKCLQKLEEVTGKKIKDSYILLDVPKIDKGGDALPDCYIKDQFGEQPQPLKKQSKICEAVHSDFDQKVKKSRLFVHPSVRSHLQDSGKFQDAISQVEKVILKN